MTGPGGVRLAEEYAPTWVERGFWLWVGLALAIVLALAIIAVRFAVRLGRLDVRDFTVTVTSDGRAGSLLAPGRRSRRFRFVVTRIGSGLIVAHARAGRPAHEIYRTEHDVRLRLADGRTILLVRGQDVPMGDGMTVRYHRGRPLHPVPAGPLPARGGRA
ncbi:hypothetical protein AB0I60_03340 [Actinosynnema sp. NPDC050436]|uniref:hypothetical protein n=1 Tax=Actinosynnema sp. NPDC050436 TaxID=3155659 RepID=UPI0033C159CE